MLLGSAVYYKRKLHNIVTKNSKDEGLMVAISIAKSEKYITTILKELGFRNTVPTTRYYDK